MKRGEGGGDKRENETMRAAACFGASTDASVSFHGTNVRVESDALGYNTRRRQPATHKYGIRLFGALSIKPRFVLCVVGFYDSYCIHRFRLLPLTRATDALSETRSPQKRVSRLQIRRRDARFFSAIEVSISATLIFFRIHSVVRILYNTL